MRIRPQFASSALLVCLLLATSPATGQDSRPAPTITVRGEGVVTALPDHAIVHFSVTTRHKDPEKARAANAKASASAMNELRALGIEERHISLAGLRLQPETKYNEATRTYDRVGFEAVRDVRVTVNDLEALPAVVAKVVQAGANGINGISYDIKDREQYRLEALRSAAQNAAAKARVLTEAAGATLGSVLQINEDGIQMPQPIMMKQMMAMDERAAASPEPDAYAAGEMEVRADVTITFWLR